mmetsp:Transcript_35273/g.59461  ORF Transcript_35273/g.59461 Transcript_35273/m.59461 type:complete len:119 (-) Transcript_35273:71-427(-)
MPPKEKKGEPEQRVLVGVYKNQGMWRARLFERNTDVYLGHWMEREEAGVAYDKAVLKLRGVEWAKKYGLNNEMGVNAYDPDEFEHLSFEQTVESLRLKAKQSLWIQMSAEQRQSFKMR